MLLLDNRKQRHHFSLISLSVSRVIPAIPSTQLIPANCYHHCTSADIVVIVVPIQFLRSRNNDVKSRRRRRRDVGNCSLANQAMHPNTSGSLKTDFSVVSHTN